MSTARDILVIDDEAVVTQGVARLCKGEGLTVDTAVSGKAGLALLDHGTYRAVLCDIMMGGMDGFQFLDAYARRGLHAPVVMITGYSTVEYAVRALGSGALDFLAKPFTVDEVLAHVRRALRYGDLLASAGAAGIATLRGKPPAEAHRLGEISWVVVEADGTARMGVNPLFTRSLADLCEVTLEAKGSEVTQGRSCAVLTGNDTLAHHVMSPLSGTVLAANERLATEPALLSSAPYTDGWLYRLLPCDLDYNLRLLQTDIAPGRSD